MAFRNHYLHQRFEMDQYLYKYGYAPKTHSSTFWAMFLGASLGVAFYFSLMALTKVLLFL